MTAGLQISVEFVRLILHELTVQAESIIVLYLYYMQNHWYWSHILVYEANLMEKNQPNNISQACRLNCKNSSRVQFLSACNFTCSIIKVTVVC